MKQIFIVIAILVVGGLGVMAVTAGQQDNPREAALVEFAKGLKDKGVVFYGAFWCPHCQNQKKLFGSAAKHLPYVECSTPDGKSMTQQCKEKKIDGFPTWDFSDGSRASGELSLQELSEKSGVVLPDILK